MNGHAPDAGRLVVQCSSCSRWAWWRGEEAAWSAGWRSSYRPSRRAGAALVRAWSCSSCYVPPQASPATSSGPSYALPAKLLEGALGARPQVVGELLERLLEVDRPRGEAYARAICEASKASKASKAWWAQWSARVLPSSRRRRRRAA